MFRYKFKRPNHININESRTYKSLIKAIAKSHRNTRFVTLLDSRSLKKQVIFCGNYPHSPVLWPTMDFTVGFVKATSDRTSRCLEGFKRWCEEVAEISWASLETDPQAVAWALRGYGLYLFEQGHPRFFTPMPSQLFKSVCRVAVLSLALPGRSTKSGRFMSLEIAGQFSHSTGIWAPMRRGGIAWQPPLCWLGIVLASGLFEGLVGVCLLTVCFWPGDCAG